MKCDAIIIRCT